MPAPMLIGTSLKMYFGYQQTLDWCRQLADIAGHHPAVSEGRVALFVLPSFPVLAPVLDLLADTGIGVGGQNVHDMREGAYTGEVSAAMLAEMGCRYAEIGHAERRRLYHEDDALIAAKTATALHQGLTPILCVGEVERGSIEDAARACIQQIDAALDQAPDRNAAPELIVAYEPHWAIGAPEPAGAAHIGGVCTRLQAHLDQLGRGHVIYGGSAGPGLLTRLEGQVQGLFLGRFVHDPKAFGQILDEVMKLPVQS